jgi:hypothetical protein
LVPASGAMVSAATLPSMLRGFEPYGLAEGVA